MRRADEMLGVDLRAARIEDRRLDRSLQELIGVTAEELVERVLAGDVHRESLRPPAGTSPHLLQARDRSRKRDADRRVKFADVDTELERVRRHDAEQLARRELALNLLTLSRRV